MSVGFVGSIPDRLESAGHGALVVAPAASDLLVRENAETWQDNVVNPILVAGPAPRAAASESNDGPVNRFQKAGLIEQGRDFAGQERNEIVGSIPDFVNDLGSPVNERDDVLEIVTAEMVAAAPPVPGLQLRRKQVGR